MEEPSLDDELVDQLVQRAAKLYHNIPSAGASFQPRRAMELVGLPHSVASDPQFVPKVKSIAKILKQDGTNVRFGTSEDEIVQRAVIAWRLIQNSEDKKVPALLEMQGEPGI